MLTKKAAITFEIFSMLLWRARVSLRTMHECVARHASFVRRLALLLHNRQPLGASSPISRSTHTKAARAYALFVDRELC